MKSNTCPDVDELERFLSSAIDAGSSAWIERHLTSCGACFSMIGEIESNRQLEPVIRTLFSTGSSQSVDEWIGQTVGRYHVLRELGRGGTGVVYEAEQEAPRRKVALKFGRPYAFDRRYEAMLRREVQLLSRLQHASIAAVYEAGQTDSDRSFFAMELVEGRPISVFVRETGPPFRQCVELFRKVCDAIAHAHQRGIIHRDIKPSNLLVESGGTPKVLDFGLARILDAQADETQTMVSMLGRVAGTVPYMSPEQVRGNPQDIDVRSDVYALGVVLYELLTGRLPYALDPINLPAASRVICEQAPAPPKNFAPALPGDLVTIVLKALEKDPARRYASAAEFSEDLGRSLRNEPVIARPASAWYQIVKFTQRHRGVAATIAISFVMLSTMAAVAAGQAYSATRERDAAQRLLLHAQESANYVFAGVGSQLRRVLGTADIQRHLAEEAYVYYTRLADEQPDDPPSLARRWAAMARLIGHAHDVGDTDRVAALSALLQGQVEQTLADFPDDPDLTREAMQAHVTLAEAASGRSEVEALSQHVNRAIDLFRSLEGLHSAGANARIPQSGPLAGTTPEHIRYRRDWAFTVAWTIGPLLVELQRDEAEEHYPESRATIEALMRTDPTLEPTFRDDVSEYAPLPPPILLRVGSRPVYEHALAHLDMGMARMALEERDVESARDHLATATLFAERLAADAPNQPGVIDLLADLRRQWAELEWQGGDAGRAEALLRSAVGERTRLVEADAKNVRWKRDFEEEVALLRIVTRMPPD